MLDGDSQGEIVYLYNVPYMNCYNFNIVAYISACSMLSSIWLFAWLQVTLEKFEMDKATTIINKYR